VTRWFNYRWSSQSGGSDSMALVGRRIARAQAKAHKVLRQIYMADTCLKLYEGDQQALGEAIATYSTDWYLDKREYNEMTDGGRRFFKRLVVDDLGGCRREQLRRATVVLVGDALYKFGRKDSLIGSVPSYEFKVYPTGQRV